MLQGSELALDRAQIDRSLNRESAVMAKGRMMGYNFIRLALKNIRKRKISGIEVLVATEFVNHEMGGVTDYNLELKGGDINFRYYQEFGQYLFDMVDTERNRQFLASHFDCNFWKIMDYPVEVNVKERSEKIKAELLNKPKPNPSKDGPAGFWEEVRKSESKQLALVRGEIEPNMEPTLQPMADIANDPTAPGYIPGPKDVKLPDNVCRRQGWPRGKKRGKSGYRGKKNNERQTANKEGEHQQSDALKFATGGNQNRAGVGVTQP